jgi:hypothetical protein
MTRRQAKDQFVQRYANGRAFDKVGLPKPTDVVLVGRGRKKLLHYRSPGNQQFRWVVEIALARCYKQEDAVEASGRPTTLSRDSVGELTRGMVTAIQANQGHFLKKHKDDWWIVATEQEVQDKISRLIASLYESRGKLQEK